MSASLGAPPSAASRPALGHFDVAIVGAGMAGASLAFELAPHLRVLLLEQESQPGYHTTGRSAALFSEIYGNDAVRALSRASRAFFDAPGAGFAEHPLLTPRGTLFFASAEQLVQLHAVHDETAPRAPALRWLQGNEVLQRLPALNPEVAQAGLYEPDACDIDVHALHQGYLRGAKRHGATLLCQAQVESAVQTQGHWTLGTRAGDARAAGMDLAILTRCMSDGVGEVAEALTGLDDRIHVLNRHVRELQSTIGVMRALETNGRIEAVRSTDPVAVQALFSSIAAQIASARSELDELAAMTRISFSAEAAASRRIRADVAAIALKAGSLHAA